MKSRWVLVVVLVVVSCFALYIVYHFPLSGAEDRETLFQVGAFEPFAQGELDGILSYSELAKHGDFGLGTLTGLDGEVVAVDGVFYHVPIDGNPKRMDGTEEASFAMVTFFEADQTLQVAEAMNYSELQTFIDKNVSPECAMYAIKVHGVYDYAKTRSVPKQTEPYPTLAEVIANQTVFTLDNVTGTMAGFRLPSYMDGVNVAGYHLHFVTDDETAGGHVLDCIVRDAVVEIDYTYDYELMLPENNQS